MIRTHPLDLPEIRSKTASNLGLKELASCARVCQDWNDSFTPPLYNDVTVSEHDSSMEILERNKHLIRYLVIQKSAHGTLLSTSARVNVVSRVMTNSTLNTLNLYKNSIGPHGAQALSEALKTNSSIITQALSEALKTNSTWTWLDLEDITFGSDRSQALSEALKSNKTVSRVQTAPHDEYY
ncbi:hypothetical protein BKA57DRAFT_506572 [Linnemannia elongata]|nr:hypothetical protein BKA57DRAFT_506572 [Linnemannia elongata]